MLQRYHLATPSKAMAGAVSGDSRPPNKTRGMGLRTPKAVEHIRLQLYLASMMALAVKFPHFTRLDTFSSKSSFS